jgi:fused signal recognition particle receptor
MNGMCENLKIVILQILKKDLKKDFSEKEEIKTEKVKKESPKEEKKGGFFGFADKIKKGLTKTREKLTTELTSLFTGKKIDEALFEELETILLTSDVGISATTYLLDSTRASNKQNKIENADEIKGLLKEITLQPFGKWLFQCHRFNKSSS